MAYRQTKFHCTHNLMSMFCPTLGKAISRHSYFRVQQWMTSASQLVGRSMIAVLLSYKHHTYISYWPNMKSRKLDTMARRHLGPQSCKKGTRPLSSHLDQTNYKDNYCCCWTDCHTCSNPPSSSVVSIALFMAITSSLFPVSWATRWARDVFPQDLGPTWAANKDQYDTILNKQ